MEGDMRMKLNMRPTSEILARRGLEPGGAVQRYIDNEVLRRNEPYVPMSLGQGGGALKKSGTLATVIGSGEIVYDAPYARYTYYGKLMVSEKTGSAWAKQDEKKVVTDKDLTYHGGGLRGAFHFERMKADHKDDILRGAARIAGGRAK